MDIELLISELEKRPAIRDLRDPKHCSRDRLLKMCYLPFNKGVIASKMILNVFLCILLYWKNFSGPSFNCWNKWWNSPSDFRTMLQLAIFQM